MRSVRAILIGCLITASTAMGGGEELQGRWSCVSIDGASVSNRFLSFVIVFLANGRFSMEKKYEPREIAITEDMYRVDGEYIRFGRFTQDQRSITDPATMTNERTGEIAIDYRWVNESKERALRFAVTNDSLVLRSPGGSVSEFRRFEH